jgi:hypothetical protein
VSPAAVALLAVALALPAAARIERSRAEVRAFRADHACPSTMRHRGACPGFHVDHIVPLCAGGADKPENMQWISVEDHRFKTLIDVRECRRQKRPAPP